MRNKNMCLKSTLSKSAVLIIPDMPAKNTALWDRERKKETRKEKKKKGGRHDD